MTPTAERSEAPLLDDIEAKARAATPGPWTVRKTGMVEDMRNVSFKVLGNIANSHNHTPYIDRENAEHIAQMSPSTTLALVSALRVAWGALESVYESGDWPMRVDAALTHINELFEKERA